MELIAMGLAAYKGKVVPLHAIKTYGEIEVYLHSLLIPAHGGVCSASRPGHCVSGIH